MRKTVILAVLAALATCLPIGANASSKTMSFALDLSSPDLNTTAANSKILDLGSIGNYDVWYTGSATVSPTSSDATLTGLNDGSIWKYEYSTDGATWNEFGKLVSTFSAQANSNGKSVSDSKVASIVAKEIKVSYNVKLESLADASASGSGSITAQAAAVPEPSSLLSFGALLSSGGLILIRRKR